MAMTPRQRLNREFLNTLKVQRGCEMCGYNANPVALQFDHIDPTTKLTSKTGRRINPSNMTSYSQAVILAEVAKCRILCSNCHAIRSYEEQHHLLSGKMSECSVRLVA